MPHSAVITLQALEEEGKGRVLVVDTGGSMRCAVLGDNLAAMGVKNGWSVRLWHRLLSPAVQFHPLRQAASPSLQGRSGLVAAASAATCGEMLKITYLYSCRRYGSMPPQYCKHQSPPRSEAAEVLLMQGVIVNGCIRDSQDIGEMSIGVKALGTHPLKSSKRDPGLRDVPVSFAGVIPSPLPRPLVLNRRHVAWFRMVLPQPAKAPPTLSTFNPHGH